MKYFLYAVLLICGALAPPTIFGIFVARTNAQALPRAVCAAHKGTFFVQNKRFFCMTRDNLFEVPRYPTQENMP